MKDLKKKNRKLSKILEILVRKNKDSDIANSYIKAENYMRLNQDASDIMTARVDIFAIEISTSFSEVIDSIARSGFSRIPVYEEELDNIKGVLYVKDLFSFINNTKANWNHVIRDAFFIPETKNIGDLLKEFQDTKIHQAIVVDEYGSVIGIISMEDILEEIVGEIHDEYDDTKPALYSKIGHSSYVFAGKISINDFSKIIGLESDEVFEEAKGDADTLAGMLIEIAGRLPKRNEVIRFENYIFQIIKADNRKIEKIKLIIKQ